MRYYLLAYVLVPPLVVLERALARRSSTRSASAEATRESVAQLVGEMILSVMLGLDVFAIYGAVVRRIALSTWASSEVATWVVAFLAIDLAYYAGHRAMHVFRAGFALHVVHHQARAYDLATGVRGPMLSALQIVPFMLPLALLGLPEEVVAPLYAVHTVYKLLVHTELVASLGPLDAVLVSPRMHMVHHARDARHHGKNFGGVLCVWDRLFGTYSAESHVDAFGLDEAPHPQPVVNNVAPWLALLGVARPTDRSWPLVPPSVAWAAFGATFVLTLAFMVRGPGLPLAPRAALGAALFVALAIGSASRRAVGGDDVARRF